MSSAPMTAPAPASAPSLPDTIKALRRAAGLSQEQLADRLGVSRQAVTKWETSIGTPDLDNIVAVARLFGVSTDYLLTGCAAQPCDIESLRRIVSFTQKKLDKTLLLRGQDGALRTVTDEDLAALLAALLA